MDEKKKGGAEDIRAAILLTQRKWAS